MVKARDVNGLGPGSPKASLVACIVPGEMAAPNLTAVAATTFSVSWRQPVHTGGCPITNYAVLLSSDQSASAPTYGVQVATIASTKLEQTVTFATGALTGLILRVKIQATN